MTISTPKCRAMFSKSLFSYFDTDYQQKKNEKFAALRIKGITHAAYRTTYRMPHTACEDNLDITIVEDYVNQVKAISVVGNSLRLKFFIKNGREVSKSIG